MEVAVAVWTPVPLTVKGMAMQLPPAMGHSKTLVVPVEVVGAVGLKVSLMVQVPGPAKPPPAPQVSKSKENGELMPYPMVSRAREPEMAVTVAVRVAGGLRGAWSEAEGRGLAVARLTPVPVTVNGMAMQLPPAM